MTDSTLFRALAMQAAIMRHRNIDVVRYQRDVRETALDYENLIRDFAGKEDDPEPEDEDEVEVA